mmetsp:Transcript_23678/g.42202  ORF Transcript_23678/g.42202 Transcript_23678/m.42202 type:complete len:596 (-) Transcript_23678:4562-6349(-)
MCDVIPPARHIGCVGPAFYSHRCARFRLQRHRTAARYLFEIPLNRAPTVQCHWQIGAHGLHPLHHQIATGPCGRKRRCRYVEIDVSRPAAGADYHLTLCGMQRRFQILRHMHQPRCHNQGIASEVACGARNDIHRQPQLAQRPIPVKHQPEIAQPRSVRLYRPSRIRVIVKDQRNGGLRHRDLWRIRKFGHDGLSLAKRLRTGTVRPQKPRMHLLLRKRGLPPAEIADGFRPMGECLPGPEPHHARQRRRVVGGPIHRSRLLLHHPPASSALGMAATGRTDSPVQIMVKRLKIGIPLLRIGALPVRVGPHTVFQKSKRIAVPACNIEVRTHRKMIEIRNPTHVIMRNRRIRETTDDIRLDPIERHHLIAGKAAKGMHMRRIGLRHRQVGQADLIKIVIIHRPEHIAPSRVQRVNIAIIARVRKPPPQPVAKGRTRGIGVTDGRVMAAIFIVGLPGGDMRVAAIALGHGRNDLAAFSDIALMRKTVMSARPIPAHTSLNIDGKHVWMLGHDPGRWRRGGRAQNHAQTCGTQCLNRPIQPVPTIIALRRLHPFPGKFANPYPGQAEGRHTCGIIGPLRLGPVLRVVTNAQSPLHKIT